MISRTIPISFFFLSLYLPEIDASTGDRLAYYHVCREECYRANCSSSEQMYKFEKSQPVLLKLAGWDCNEECRHKCQFETISYLISIGIKHNNIPQFHGKWTFKRILGAQEPASCFFSLLNLITSILGWREYLRQITCLKGSRRGGKCERRKKEEEKKKIKKERIENVGKRKSVQDEMDHQTDDDEKRRRQMEEKSDEVEKDDGDNKKEEERKKKKEDEIIDEQYDQYFVLTNISAVLGVNAWFWSMVFHFHDSSMTEKMDYFSATSLVIYSLFYVLLRVLDMSWISSSRTFSPRGILAALFASFYIYHVHYLAYVSFDYGYNMKVNIVAGVSGSVLWIIWSLQKMYSVTGTNKVQKVTQATFPAHIKQGILCIIALNVSLLLEIGDFPPILNYTIDAHSLWHLATFPVPIFWFRFLADDAKWTCGQNFKRTKISENENSKNVLEPKYETRSSTSSLNNNNQNGGLARKIT